MKFFNVYNEYDAELSVYVEAPNEDEALRYAHHLANTPGVMLNDEDGDRMLNANEVHSHEDSDDMEITHRWHDRPRDMR